MNGWKKVLAGCVFSTAAGLACGSSNSPQQEQGDSGGKASGPTSGTGSGGPGTSFACVVSVVGMLESCVLYGDVPASSAARLEADCSATVATSCPSAGVLGTCTVAPAAGSTVTNTEYTYTAAGAVALQAQCSTENGTWTSSFDSGLGDIATSCAQVAKCCPLVGLAFMMTCTAAAASNNEETCASELSVLKSSSTCFADGG